MNATTETVDVRLEANGFPLTVRMPAGDHIARVMQENGDWYERAMLDDMVTRGKAGTIVDVGACFGTHALFMAAHGFRVIAFEPNPVTMRLLRHNIETNRMHASIVAHECGLWQREAAATILPGLENNAGNTRAIPGRGPVRLASLDSFALGTVSAIKIDVEGAEADVLIGALNTIRLVRPLIYAECATPYEHGRVSGVLVEGLGYTQFARFNSTPTYGFAP